MMIEAVLSLTVVGILIARAVNILGGEPLVDHDAS
jgi:hypothetical protein